MSTENTCFSKHRKMGLITKCQTGSINLIVLVISFVHLECGRTPCTNASFLVLNAPNAPNAHELSITCAILVLYLVPSPFGLGDRARNFLHVDLKGGERDSKKIMNSHTTDVVSKLQDRQNSNQCMLLTHECY